MKGIIEMKIRMTWDQIKNNYPERWVRLEQVVWESEGSPDIASAVVAKATKKRPTGQDYKDAVSGKCAVRFIESDNVFHSGYVTA